jgi:anti-sigma-K factor RskA
MTLDDEHIVLAAEYVLGTLDEVETAIAEQLLASEPEFIALVRDWERRLGELNAMVAPVEPPADLLDKIRARLPDAFQSSFIHLPDADAAREARLRLGPAPQLEMPRPPRAQRLVGPAPDDNIVSAPSIPHNPRVGVLDARLRRSRRIGTAFAALAALFAGVFVTSLVRPDLLPQQLRPPAQTVEVVKTVEKTPDKPAEKPNRFVAVLQRDAVSPAFILSVDVENRTMTVRRVAAEPAAGKSYELWLVSSKYSGPKSLGVVGADEFSKPAQLAGYDPQTISDATYAISLEPEGGSPTGTATGPILWTGKLIEAVPPQAQ